MQDVLFIGLALGFFGACVAYVRGLDRLVRSAAEADPAPAPLPAAAAAELVRS